MEKCIEIKYAEYYALWLINYSYKLSMKDVLRTNPDLYLKLLTLEIPSTWNLKLTNSSYNDPSTNICQIVYRIDKKSKRYKKYIKKHGRIH